MKKILSLFMLVLFAAGVNAKEEVDGIAYNINKDDNTASVTQNQSYSGDIVIPATIDVEGITYKVTSIEDFAFFQCTGVTNVTLPNSISKIGMYAFKNCKGIRSINLPEGLSSIGDQAFRSCESIEKIDIPGTVSSLGHGTFMDCTSLTGVSLGEGITTIGESAFMRCRSLEGVVIPNSVTVIEPKAFYICSALGSASIGDNVSVIGDEAFYSCSSLGEITIPSKVTGIGRQAFAYCTDMARVTFGRNVTEIGKGVFDNCQSIAAVRCMSDKPAVIDDTRLLSHYTLTVLYVPEGAAENYSNADVWKDFIVCKEIADDVTINDRLDDFMADGVHYIASSGMNTAKVVKLNDGGLYKDHVVIPESVEYNGTSYVVKYVDNRAFEYCKELTDIDLPKTIEYIGDWAFSSCIYLNAVDLPKAVKYIGASAFFACNYLKEIVIPAGIEYIGDQAFAGCIAMNEIYSESKTPISIFSYTFEFREDQTLHVPTGCTDIYRNTDYWSSFLHFTEDEELGINNIESDFSDSNAVYDLQGRRVNSPSNGLFITNGKKVLMGK